MKPTFSERFWAFVAHWFPVDYERYLKTADWKRKADAAKARAGWRCQACNRPQGLVHLEAHHRTYERLGYELPGDLTVLCREDCHPAITAIRSRLRAGPTWQRSTLQRNPNFRALGHR